jgi:pantoate--beta-alanine ligase
MKASVRPLLFHTIAEFRAWRAALAPAAPLAFVPTMGALHEGHVSLAHHARKLTGPAGSVAASIFVNPTQFGPAEDFSKYPRTLNADLDLLAPAGVDAVFAPSAEEMYPTISELSTQHSALSTSVDPGPIATILEGALRPGHFRGVCTVVLKLLNIVTPTHLVMGQKDYQQNAVLRQMIRELNIPTAHVMCPTIREPDGLAMSSRNRYLSPADRPRAVAIHRALTAAKTAFQSGEKNPHTLETLMRHTIESAGLSVQYALPAHADTLSPFPATINAPCVLLVAAQLGATRLIDNICLEFTL